jgi:sulfite exporter TauE/SafE
MGLEIAPATLVALASAFAAALATGFLGSLHCIGMCGTTVAVAIAKPASRPAPQSRPSIWLRLATATPTVNNASYTAAAAAPSSIMRASLSFNAGRIISYVVAGALVSGIAGNLAERVVMNELAPLRLALFTFGQCLVIATGFYIAGATALLAPFERAGQRIWNRLQPVIGPRLQAHFRDGQAQPFAFGLLWGWIPCGLVYGTLATAMASGSMQHGALIMAGFGLGTLPAMLAASAAAAPMRRLAQMRRVRIAAGAVIISLGVVGLSKLPQLADFAALAKLCFGNP